jgi:hypothetical protein
MPVYASPQLNLLSTAAAGQAGGECGLLLGLGGDIATWLTWRT